MLIYVRHIPLNSGRFFFFFFCQKVVHFCWWDGIGLRRDRRMTLITKFIKFLCWFGSGIYKWILEDFLVFVSIMLISLQLNSDRFFGFCVDYVDLGPHIQVNSGPFVGFCVNAVDLAPTYTNVNWTIFGFLGQKCSFHSGIHTWILDAFVWIMLI